MRAPPAALAFLVALAGVVQVASAVTLKGALRSHSAADEGRILEPTEDEKGLFGPPFAVPLLEVKTGAVAAQIQMRLAVTPPEQHHGLMFIKDLPEDSGMLFLYPTAQKRVLWMKNTYVALDAAWFTQDLVLREVHNLVPLDLTYRWSDRSDIQMGLEMPGGWFAKHNLSPENLKIDEQALKSALVSRGFDPAYFLGNADKVQLNAQQSQPQPQQQQQQQPHAEDASMSADVNMLAKAVDDANLTWVDPQLGLKTP